MYKIFLNQLIIRFETKGFFFFFIKQVVLLYDLKFLGLIAMLKKRNFSSRSINSSSQYWVKESELEAKASTYNDSTISSDPSLLSFPSEMFDPFSRKRKRLKDTKAKKRQLRDKSLDSHYKYTQNRINKEDFRKRIVDLVMSPILSGVENVNSMNKFPRFHHYIQTGVDTLHVAPLEESSLEMILSFVPMKYKTNFPAITGVLIEEIQYQFTYAIKKSIVEFTLNQVSTEDSSTVGLKTINFLRNLFFPNL